MSGSIRLGKIFGIPVDIHYTWFIIFVLVTLTLSTQYFPRRYEWPTMCYWTMGVITSLLFFASVLLHELAHSLISRLQGIPVHRITLFLFGGVASITREAATPLGEFLMALAGPATSMVIAVFFGSLWLLTRYILRSGPLAAITGYLGLINLSLALFNLIPGFPLDGGRLLRSFLWGVTGDYRRSTQIAIGFGRSIAMLFIIGGVAWAITGHWLDGIWLAFIGWFLENAASQSYRSLITREALRGVQVGELMSRECPLVPPSVSLNELVNDYILPQSRRCFFVHDGTRMQGMVTLHHLKQVPKSRWDDVLVSEVATPFEEVTKVSASEDALKALELMDEKDVNQMPVVENGEVVGMIRRDNLLHFIRTRLELGI